MNSFRTARLSELAIPQRLVTALTEIAAARGRQDLYGKQTPQVLKVLREVALVESVESSNRIEGVTVARDRLRPLVLGRAKPVDRSEKEIAGYRRALSWIHAKAGEIPVTPDTFKQFHRLIHGEVDPRAGEWKDRPNNIVARYPDGTTEIRFRPVEPQQVPKATESLCLLYQHVLEQKQVTPILAVSALVLDFLCIHPFPDGNGRVSRLLMLLALYQLGYEVGRYISLERLIETTKESYYARLYESSQGWHESRHDVMPFFSYTVDVINMAYTEFERRAGRESAGPAAKGELVTYAIKHMLGEFSVEDVARQCPGVSRATIRLVMARLRKEGRVEAIGRGPGALWRLKEEKS
ncbi:MAG: Fic family protein [Nitrospirae bacterium]|nr:Fic family protein [Nitrospirota bacterium]